MEYMKVSDTGLDKLGVVRGIICGARNREEAESLIRITERGLIEIDKTREELLRLTENYRQSTY